MSDISTYEEGLEIQFKIDYPNEIVKFLNGTINGKNTMRLDYTIDVMNIMTTLRNDWNMKYPEEK